jgi:hypothetical protein
LPGQSLFLAGMPPRVAKHLGGLRCKPSAKVGPKTHAALDLTKKPFDSDDTEAMVRGIWALLVLDPLAVPLTIAAATVSKANGV